MSTKSNQQAMGLQVFYNEEVNVNIRTKVINGESWFVGKDICNALGFANHNDALSRLDADERDGVGITDPMGRSQEVTAINESGLYHLIFISRKPEARAFRRWVTNTVLPSIRRTGSYSSTGVQPAIEQRAKLPLPKFRPFYKEWKEFIAPYISSKEIDELAEELCVTPGHVRKVYQGTSMSRGIVDMLTATASLNRSNGVAYPPSKGVYEQMVILWDEDTNKNG